ncbi:MAG: FAD-dependent oxidoreductase [Spirochaetes bacterium]|jgi:NADPH-dependent 2,4-dienoyl-CoA reductase/sulfur reductase-like enzyme|nr:FAD-dependent oxidoreductase [Spirochaetota bacterium]NLJ04439.1 NAD(P)/FAD-dependent oxidoreductase [Exilispira sp.]
MNRLETDILVIGAGAAGMGAAICAANSGVSVIVVERNPDAGGILNQCIHNGFGLHYFKKEFTGPEFAYQLYSKTKESGIQFLFNHFLLQLDLKNKTAIFASEEGIKLIACKALIYTAGARERPFGSLLIPGDRVSGIFTAGVAQRLTNIENRLPGTKALILGSGDIGLIMARRLTLEGVEVVAVCERMPYPGGLARNIDQCLKDFGIPLLLSTTVTEVRGDGRLREVITSSLDENYNIIEGTQRSWSVDTLVLSVGLVPSTTPIMDYFSIDSKSRGVIVDNCMRTDKDWIFSAGNCVIIYDLVDYVTYQGEMAGRSAVNYIKNGNNPARYPIKKGNGVGVINCSYYVENSDLELYIRVNKPKEKAKLVVRSDNTIIYEGKPSAFIPSEMVRVKIKAEKIDDSFKKSSLVTEIIDL